MTAATRSTSTCWHGTRDDNNSNGNDDDINNAHDTSMRVTGSDDHGGGGGDSGFLVLVSNDDGGYSGSVHATRTWHGGGAGSGASAATMTTSQCGYGTATATAWRRRRQRWPPRRQLRVWIRWRRPTRLQPLPSRLLPLLPPLPSSCYKVGSLYLRSLLVPTPPSRSFLFFLFFWPPPSPLRRALANASLTPSSMPLTSHTTSSPSIAHKRASSTFLR